MHISVILQKLGCNLFRTHDASIASLAAYASSTKEVVYHDITSRDNAAAPRCDIYMSGAPCPAFSTAGKGGGLSDPRGSVLLHSVDYVLTQTPRVAFFENVKGLVNKRNRPVLDALAEVLRSAGYSVKAKVLDTCTHGAIPHHRPRVFVVAVLKSRLGAPFVWPTCLPCHSFDRFLVNNVSQEESVSPGRRENIEAAWKIAKKKFQEAEYTKRNAQRCPCWQGILVGHVECVTLFDKGKGRQQRALPHVAETLDECLGNRCSPRMAQAYG